MLSFLRQRTLFEAEIHRMPCPWPKFPRAHRWIPFLFFVSFQSPVVRFFFGPFLISLPCDYRIAQCRLEFKMPFCIYLTFLFCILCTNHFFIYHSHNSAHSVCCEHVVIVDVLRYQPVHNNDSFYVSSLCSTLATSRSKSL